MGAVRIWVKHHAAGPVVVPLAVVVLVAVVFEGRAAQDWLGRPADTALLVHAYTVGVLGSMLAAAAAWTASASRRRGSERWEGSAPRGLLARLALLTFSAWLVGMGAYAVLSLIAAGRTAGAGGAFTIPLGLAVLTAAWLLLFAAAGTGLGALTGSRLAAPAAAVIAYGLFIASALTGRGGEAMIPVVQEHWDPAFAPDLPALLLASAWLGVLAMVALLAVVAWRERRTTALVRMALSVAAAGAVAAGLLQVTAGGVSAFAVPRPAPAEPACAAVPGGATACVWPAEARLLPAYAEAAGRAQQALGPLGTAQRFVQFGLSSGPGDVVLNVVLPAPTAADLVPSMVGPSAPTAPVGCAEPETPNTGGLPGSLLLQQVVLARAGLGGSSYSADGDAFVGVVLGSAPPAQDGWLAAAGEAVAACRAVPPPPPPS